MILEQLDRSMYENMRLAIIAAGYIPDRAAYATPALYKAAKVSLKASLADHQLIEIFGVGTSAARDEKSINTIFIKRVTEGIGDIGAYGVTKFVPKDVNGVTKFDKERYPSSTQDIVYEVRFVANTVKFERIIVGLIYKVFGTKKYIPLYLNSGSLDSETVLCLKQGDSDVSSTDVKEKVYQFVLQDIWVEEFETVKENIPRMTDITYGLGVTEETPEEIVIPETEIPADHFDESFDTGFL